MVARKQARTVLRCECRPVTTSQPTPQESEGWEWLERHGRPGDVAEKLGKGDKGEESAAVDEATDGVLDRFTHCWPPPPRRVGNRRARI